MKIFKKDNMKQITVICCIIAVIMLAIMSVLSYQQYRSYKQEINNCIAVIIERIVRENPELEEKVIQSLQKIEAEDIQKGKDILDRYGYQEEEVAFERLEKQMNQNRGMNILIVGIMSICFFLVFLLFILWKDRKLNQITEYVRRIQNKDYSLKIQDNAEGELSLLRNEIYKITVMLKEQTETLQKEKNGLSNSLSDISHQLKTPLTSLSVMLDILKENPEMEEEKKQEFLFEITRQLEWMNWLIIALLKLSKLDSGVVKFKQEEIVIEELVKEVVHYLAIPIDIKSIHILTKGDEKICFVGDYHWMIEALSNILKNAIEHTEEGKVVEIEWNENPLYTEIKIRDEGKGIPREDIIHIFERFYKGKNSSKESVGIGLALAKSIIKGQNGDITVKSEEGRGTEFCIQFYKNSI